MIHLNLNVFYIHAEHNPTRNNPTKHHMERPQHPPPPHHTHTQNPPTMYLSAYDTNLYHTSYVHARARTHTHTHTRTHAYTNHFTCTTLLKWFDCLSPNTSFIIFLNSHLIFTPLQFTQSTQSGNDDDNLGLNVLRCQADILWTSTQRVFILAFQ